jgi:methylase of polypeptide subunit release factors
LTDLEDARISCGDGRIVRELLLSNHQVLSSSRIIGYDIDASAIDKSLRNLDGFALPTNVKHKPVFRYNNFLSVSRQDLDRDLNQTTDNHLKVVFGGPPYTPKQHDLLRIGMDLSIRSSLSKSTFQVRICVLAVALCSSTPLTSY